jgi:hypothetical protein
MKNLRTKLDELRDSVYEQFNTLISKRDYDFAQDLIDNEEWGEGGKEELQEWLDKGDFYDMDDYDFFAFLPLIYYNDRRGDERAGYVLSISKDKGLRILDEEDYKDFYIGFSDVNLIDSQIEILEEIESRF